MLRLSVFALLLLACSVFAFPEPQTNGNSACAKWCADYFPNAGKDCTSLAAKKGGPCYECGPSAPPGHKKTPCGGICVECKVGEECKDKQCKPKCPPGKELCGGECKSTAWGTETDCSKCGHKCKVGEECKDKQCKPKCPPGKELCGGECKSTAWGTDKDCSKCGDKCPVGWKCNKDKKCTK